MARLSNIRRKTLSRTDLENFPVWVWDEANEYHQPISEAAPSLEDYGVLFIKARFECDGHSFDGYLIGSSSYYAFGLFVGEREFVMNLRLPDLVEQNLNEICSLLTCQPFKLFPIRFESQVRLNDGREIAGMLMP